MDFNEVKEIIDIVNASDITYFNYEGKEGHLILDKSLTRNEIATETVKKDSSINENTELCTEKKEDIRPKEDKEPKEENLYIIASPMVGTYYGSPSPNESSFVNVGDSIKKGEVLCIIEAMKLMNEIESEVNGTIMEILVKYGEMVEYGQPLFKVKED